MLLKLKLVLLSCLLTLPSVAAAQNHNVIITGFGFFPQVTYVKPGDMVYFKNDAGFTHRLSGGQNTRNPWSVVVEPYQTVAMRVTGLTDSTYNSVTFPLIPAVFSFDEPPAAATAD